MNDKVSEKIENINTKILKIQATIKDYETKCNDANLEDVITAYKKKIEELSQEIKQLETDKKDLEIEIEKEKSKLSLQQILDDLENNYKFGDNYLFLDLEIGKYVLIDMEEEIITYDEEGNQRIDYVKSSSHTDKGNIEDLIRAQLKILQTRGIIQKSVNRFDDKTIKSIKSRISAMYQSFDRFKEQIFISKNTPTLNKFLPTKYTKYHTNERISYATLREEIKKFKRFEILIKNNVNGNEEYLEYLLNWISAEMNTPQNLHTSIILIGDQGSGKSQLMETIFKENVYNKSNVAIMNNKAWEDKFNSIFEDKTFLINNEISLVGNKKYLNIAEDIKRLITDNTIMIRGIQKANIEKQISFSMCFLSNHDHPLFIENNDRRFTVFGRAKPLINNEEYQKFIKDNNEDMASFIKAYKDEVKEVLFLIKSLRFDKKVLSKPLNTEMKQQIIQETLNIQSVVNNTPVQSDVITNQINHEIDNNLGKLATIFRDKDTLSLIVFIVEHKFNENTSNIIKNMFAVGIFTNQILNELYRKIDPSASNEKIGRWFNNFLESANPIKIDGKATNVKVFNIDDIETKKENLIAILNNTYIDDEEIPF